MDLAAPLVRASRHKARATLFRSLLIPSQEARTHRTIHVVDSTQYTGRAWHALTLAEEEAISSGDNSVSTGHILLGLLREQGCIGARALESQGITLEAVRQQLSQISHHREHGHLLYGISERLPFIIATVRVLRQARLETSATGHINQMRTPEGRPVICTGELLLGLLYVPTDVPASGVAAEVLFRLGIDISASYEQVYTQVAEFVRRSPPDEPMGEDT